MTKKVIKLTESQLEKIVQSMVNEERKMLTSTNNPKRLNEAKKFIKGFHSFKKQKLSEGYSREEINEGWFDWVTDWFGNDDEEKTEDGEESSEDGGTIKSTAIDTGKEWVIGWILSQMGVTGELNRIFKIGLSTIEPSDYPKLLDPADNCKWLSDTLFESTLQYIVQKIAEGFGKSGGGESGSLFGTSIAKAFKNLTDNTEFKDDMKKYIGSAVCKALGGESGEFELTRELSNSGLDPRLVKGIQKKL